jgi:PAS domain S-box-containing protein
LSFDWSAIAQFLADADAHPVVVIDATGIVRLCNRRMLRLRGVAGRDVIGRAWQPLFDRPARDAVGRALRQVRRGRSRRTGIALRSATGERVIGDLVLHPVGHAAVGILTAEPDGKPDDLRRMLDRRMTSLGDRHHLSVREREVLAHLVRGRTVEEIGAALGITPRTAKFHQANVLAKLGIASRVEITRLMLEPDR